jgi:hypothetical protein
VARLVEEQLRSLADRVPLPDPEVADRVAACVVERHRPERAVHPRPARRPRRRTRLVAGAALALAGAAAVLVVGGPSHNSLRIDPAAAAALRRAAITAAHQPGLPPLAPGKLYHFRDTEMGWIERTTQPGAYTSCGTACPPAPADWVVKARIVSDTWVAADGSAIRVSHAGQATFRSPEVRRTFRHMYGLPARHPFGVNPPTRFAKGQYAFGWGLDYGQIRHLPASPAKLKRLVREQAAPSSQATDPTSANSLAFEEFVVIGDIMRTAPLQPGVRAAFYTVLSRLPGIEYDGRVTDPLGRPGIRVSMQRSASEPPAILIFDPRNAHLLSEGGGGYSEWSVVNADTAPR